MSQFDIARAYRPFVDTQIRRASRRSGTRGFDQLPKGSGTFPDMFKRWSKERYLADDRQVILEAYVHELRGRNPDQLVGLVPTEPGFWNIPELDRNEADVDLGVRALRPAEGAGEIHLVVDVRSSRRWYRGFIEGFVIGGDGELRDLTAAEWKAWA